MPFTIELVAFVLAAALVPALWVCAAGAARRRQAVPVRIKDRRPGDGPGLETGTRPVR